MKTLLRLSVAGVTLLAAFTLYGQATNEVYATNITKGVSAPLTEYLLGTTNNGSRMRLLPINKLQIAGSNIVGAVQFPTVFNVRLYGAKGDGVTDDTASISNAWYAWTQAGAAEPGVLYFPAGVYLDTGTHVGNVGGTPGIPDRNIGMIVGDGAKSVWACSATNGYFLRSYNSAITLKDIVLKGPGKTAGKITGYWHDGPAGLYQMDNVTFFNWSWYGHVSDDSYSVTLSDVYFVSNHVGLGMGYLSDGWTVQGKFVYNNCGLEMGADTAVAIPGSTNLNNHAAPTALSSRSTFLRVNMLGNKVGAVIGGRASSAIDLSGYWEENGAVIQLGHDPSNSWWPTNALEFQQAADATMLDIYLHDLAGLANTATGAVINAYVPCHLTMERNYGFNCADTSYKFLQMYNQATNMSLRVGIHGAPGYIIGLPFSVDPRWNLTYGYPTMLFGPFVPTDSQYAATPYSVDAGATVAATHDYGAFRSAFWLNAWMTPTNAPRSSVQHVKNTDAINGTETYSLTLSNANLTLYNGTVLPYSGVTYPITARVSTNASAAIFSMDYSLPAQSYTMTNNLVITNSINLPASGIYRSVALLLTGASSDKTLTVNTNWNAFGGATNGMTISASKRYRVIFETWGTAETDVNWSVTAKN